MQVYQLVEALQRKNPDAHIHINLNFAEATEDIPLPDNPPANFDEASYRKGYETGVSTVEGNWKIGLQSFHNETLVELTAVEQISNP